jgi:hypothetical protein
MEELPDPWIWSSPMDLRYSSSHQLEEAKLNTTELTEKLTSLII